MLCNESPRTFPEVRVRANAVQKAAVFRYSRHVASLILIAMGIACDARAEQRAEARTLLIQLNAVADEHSLTERSVALEALGKLPLKAAGHKRTRDLCRAAQLGLLEAETAQASARKALSAASAAQPGGKLSLQDAQAIATAIERSNRALADAKARFPACDDALRELLIEAH